MNSNPLPPPVSTVKWSPKEQDFVRSMLAKGATAGEVAKQFDISRNAAIGRIHRAGMSYTTRPKPPPVPKSPLRDNTTIPYSHPSMIVIPMPLFVTGNEWCKWPVSGHPDIPGKIICCGAPVAAPLHPYCAYHQGLARPEP
jgi:hypothetical protein